MTLLLSLVTGPGGYDGEYDGATDIPQYDDHDSEHLPRRSGRSRIMTERGLAHMIDSKETRIKTVYNSLVAKCENLNSLMKMNAQKKDVQSRFVHWISLYDEFCNIYDDLNTLGVDPDRLADIISWFESNGYFFFYSGKTWHFAYSMTIIYIHNNTLILLQVCTHPYLYYTYIQ